MRNCPIGWCISLILAALLGGAGIAFCISGIIHRDHELLNAAGVLLAMAFVLTLVSCLFIWSKDDHARERESPSKKEAEEASVVHDG